MGLQLRNGHLLVKSDGTLMNVCCCNQGHWKSNIGVQTIYWDYNIDGDANSGTHDTVAHCCGTSAPWDSPIITLPTSPQPSSTEYYEVSMGSWDSAHQCSCPSVNWIPGSVILRFTVPFAGVADPYGTGLTMHVAVVGGLLDDVWLDGDTYTADKRCHAGWYPYERGWGSSDYPYYYFYHNGSSHVFDTVSVRTFCHLGTWQTVTTSTASHHGKCHADATNGCDVADMTYYDASQCGPVDSYSKTPGAVEATIGHAHAVGDSSGFVFDVRYSHADTALSYYSDNGYGQYTLSYRAKSHPDPQYYLLHIWFDGLS